MDTHLAITATTTTGDLLTATAVEVHRGIRLATSDGRVCEHFTGTVFVKGAT